MIQRRSFLAGIIAAAAAPSFVRKDSLMGLWVPKQTKIIGYMDEIVVTASNKLIVPNDFCIEACHYPAGITRLEVTISSPLAPVNYDGSKMNAPAAVEWFHYKFGRDSMKMFAFPLSSGLGVS